ncbi:MAG: hypothetical protein Q7U05_01060 [Polaromonas sp.]|nr:hypothetical protein [Polaromonas sp.]
MAAPTPQTEPAQLIVGDSAKWLKSLPDYLPQDGWQLTYTLVNADATINFTANSQDDEYLVNVAPAVTGAWASGAYTWRASVSKTDETHTVASGTLTIAPAFGAAALDARSFARVALANVEAYLANPQNLTSASYEIQGRKLQRIGIPELLSLRDRYKAEVLREEAAERMARGLPDRRRVMVRFGP